MTEPLVSIVIPALDQLRYTRACIEAIVRNTPPVYEIIVIDNASQDDTPQYLEQTARSLPTLRYVRTQENVGYSLANNQAAQMARGDYLLLLNNDTEPEARWLDIMLGTARKHNVGITAPKLLYPENRTTQHVGYVYNTENRIYYPIYQGLDEHDERVCRERQMQAVLGACMLIPRKIYNQVGGLELYALEDIDLCLKVGAAGYRVMASLKSVVLHHTSITLFNTESSRLVHTKIEGFTARWPLDRRKADDVEFLRQDGYRFDVLEPQASRLSFEDERTLAFERLDEARKVVDLNQRLPLFQAALAVYPTCREINIELTSTLLDLNLIDEAAALIENYLRLCPDDYDFFTLVIPALKAAARDNFILQFANDLLVAADATSEQKNFAQQLMR